MDRRRETLAQGPNSAGALGRATWKLRRISWGIIHAYIKVAMKVDRRTPQGHIDPIQGLQFTLTW